MKIGMSFLGIGPFSAPEPMTHLAAQKSEQCGFESLWMADHSAIPDGHKSSCPYTPDGKIPPWGEATPLNEPIVALSYIAALTSKVRLVPASIDPAPTPPILCSQGSGHTGHRVPRTCSVGNRQRLVRGGVRRAGARLPSAWQAHRRGAPVIACPVAGHPSTFKGEHFNFERIRSFPKPVQKGGVPILIGGHSRAAARRAARLGDGFYPVPPASFPLPKLPTSASSSES